MARGESTLYHALDTYQDRLLLEQSSGLPVEVLLPPAFSGSYIPASVGIMTPGSKARDPCALRKVFNNSLGAERRDT